MKFARWVFLVAGVYGVLVLLPQYLMEDRVGRDYPPPITHPEYFYGFVGVALAWQAAFLVIARDPVRYRLFMIPAVLEKATFGIAAVVLYIGGRIPAMIFGAALIDLMFGLLFVVAFRVTAAPTVPPEGKP